MSGECVLMGNEKSQVKLFVVTGKLKISSNVLRETILSQASVSTLLSKRNFASQRRNNCELENLERLESTTIRLI